MDTEAKTQRVVAVSLSIAELTEGARVGVAKVLDSVGRVPRFGYRPGGIWTNHIMGAQAEAVVHKYTGWPWHKGTGNFGKPDVGWCGVRWCGDRDPYLKVTERGNPLMPQICVTGSHEYGNGLFTIEGWALPLDVKRECKPIGGEAPHWRMPVERLHSIHELLGRHG